MLGTPENDNICKYVDTKLWTAVMSRISRKSKRDLGAVVEHDNADAIDLLEKMLVFDPDERITGTPFAPALRL